MFETGFDEWPYATHGGTVFVIAFGESLKPFAITCGHVVGDFDAKKLVVTDRKTGNQFATIKSLYKASALIENAEGTESLDIIAYDFDDRVNLEYFGNDIYRTDMKTLASSREGDELFVHGNNKEDTVIDEKGITAAYADIFLVDSGSVEHDITQRRAQGKITNDNFSNLSGLSGAPVFNITRNAITGIVVRGGIHNKIARVRYVDILDIYFRIKAIHEKMEAYKYMKRI